MFQNAGRAGGAKRRQLRRQNAVQRRLAGVDGFGHVAGFKKRIQPRRLSAGQAKRALHTIRIQPHGMGRASGGAKSAVGGSGMPKPIMRWHHRHTDTYRNLIARHQRGQHGTPGKPARFGQRQSRWHHDGSHMQQSALMRIIIISGIDQNAVRQRGESRLHSRPLGAHDMSAGRARIKRCDIARDAGFLRVLRPGRHGAAQRIQHQPRRLAPHFWR